MRRILGELGLWVLFAVSIFGCVPQKQVEGPLAGFPAARSPQAGLLQAQPSLFAGLPLHEVGELATAGEYSLRIDEAKIDEATGQLALSLTISNDGVRAMDLGWAVQLREPGGGLVLPAPGSQAPGASAPARPDSLPGSSKLSATWVYPASGQPGMQAAGLNQYKNYRLVFAPRGWSGQIAVFRIVPRSGTPGVFSTPTTPADPVEQAAPTPNNAVLPDSVALSGNTALNYFSTGDPWKMLVIVYPQTDATYVDVDGVTKHLTATMPATEMNAMVSRFQQQPHRGVVYDYSDHAAEMEAHIIYATRPLSSVSEVGGKYSYWPGREDTRPEVDLYAPTGMYDSVIIMWQASDPNTGQSIPSGGWGWGGWMQYNGMTYATVFNLGWYWPGDPCKGEVFLHEWLHGVTGFYMFLGYPFPVEDLHGAEEAGYTTNASGCWEPWLRDYMRGRVLENGVYKGISPQAWQRGSITNYNIQGWRGEYYNNDTLSDLPVMVRDDPNIDFDWQGSPPHPLVNGDHFSVRWTRRMTFENFSYRFKIFHDDGARLYLDGTKIFENWCANCSLEETVDWPVTAGQHLVTYEMYESAGWAGAKLNWSIIDNGQPAGHIDLPATGAEIEPGPVDFTAEAWDNAGGSGVKEVEFFVYYSGAWHLAGTDTSAPYSVVWTAPDGLPEQALQFSIHVTDRAGNELVDAGGVRQAHYAACLTCGPAESGWPLLRGNLLKNGRSPYSGPRMPLLAWSVSGSLRGTPPALDETGRVFLGMGNQVLAVDPDGRTAWTYTAAAADPENKRFTASPAVTHSGALYIPNNDGSLYAFSTATGSLKWTFPTCGWTTSAPTVGPDGVIYFGSSDTYLRALTPGGKLKWKFQAGSWVQSSPALGPDGSVYFGASDQCVYRLNPDGTQKWKTCFPWEEYNFFDGPPALGADGTVYIASVRGNLFAFNGSDGGLKWKYSTGLDANAESGSASPAVGSDGTIYITSGNQNYGLFAIRPNGTLKWKYALPASPYCSPSIDAGGVIYTVADDGGLYAVGPDGKLKWKLTLETGGRGLSNNPVIGPGGRIYVGAYWGAKLYAVSEGGEHPLYLPALWR